MVRGAVADDLASADGGTGVRAAVEGGGGVGVEDEGEHGGWWLFGWLVWSFEIFWVLFF